MFIAQPYTAECIKRASGEGPQGTLAYTLNLSLYTMRREGNYISGRDSLIPICLRQPKTD